MIYFLKVISLAAMSLFLLSNPLYAIKLSKSMVTNPKQAAEQTFKDEVINKCEFKVKSIKPGIEMGGTPKIGLKGIEKTGVNITFDVVIEVINGSAIDLAMIRSDFTLIADDKAIPPEFNDPTATATVAENHTFPKGKTTEMPVLMKVPPEKATDRVIELTKSKDIQYRVDGTFYFSFMSQEIVITVPLTQGTIESKKPEGGQ